MIVGSGAAGIAAARQVQGPGTCIVDIGDEPTAGFPPESLKAALGAGAVRALLGERWEMLDNLANPALRHPKARAAALAHVFRGEPYEVNGADGTLLVSGCASGAAGGLANIWGAQLMRYTEADLQEAGEWPITAAQLAPYYDDLEGEIGLAGEHDDMEAFLGPASELVPPPPLVPAAARLLHNYAKRRRRRPASALTIGRSRLAVLSNPFRGRPAYRFGESEFFTSGLPGLYTPLMTLNELVSQGRVGYVRGIRATGFVEHDDHVELQSLDRATGSRRTFRARHVLLACGTIQTAQLVLNMRGAEDTSLPFMDHPPTLLPIFLPAAFGQPVLTSTYPVQLAGTVSAGSAHDMITFYYPGGMLWSDLLADIPLPAAEARTVLGAVMGGMLVAQTWSATRPSRSTRLRLGKDGRIRIEYPSPVANERTPLLVSELRALGCLTHRWLAKVVPPSWGFHHAGTLPMRARPSEFECHPDGRLWDSKRIRVIDGSVLPTLPAKNISLTIMANAARIADLARKCAY